MRRLDELIKVMAKEKRIEEGGLRSGGKEKRCSG